MSNVSTPVSSPTSSPRGETPKREATFTTGESTPYVVENATTTTTTTTRPKEEVKEISLSERTADSFTTESAREQELASKLKETEQANQKLQEKIESLKQKKSEALKKAEEAQKTLTEANTQLEALKSKPIESAEKNTQLEEAQASVQEAIQNLENLNIEKKQLQEDIKEAENALEASANQMQLQKDAIVGLRLQKEKLSKKLEKVKTSATTQAEEQARKLAEAESNAKQLAQVKADLIELISQYHQGSSEITTLISFFANKFAKYEKTKEGIEKAKQELKQAKQEFEEQKAALEEAGKDKEKEQQEVPPPAQPPVKLKVSAIADAKSPDEGKDTALKYLTRKLFSDESIKKLKEEYAKISDPNFPRVTTDSFAKFLAGEVSRAFEKAEVNLLDNISEGSFTKDIQENLFKELKTSIVKQVEAGNIPGLNEEEKSQIVNFINQAIGALVNPNKVLGEEPKPTWLNSVIRNIAISSLSFGAGVFAESTLLELLPQLALDLIEAAVKYTGSVTVPLLCAIVGVLLYNLSIWLRSRFFSEETNKSIDSEITALLQRV